VWNVLPLDVIYESIQKDLTKVEDNIQSVSKATFDRLSELLDYSLESRGKRIRPALTLLSGKFYNYDLDYLLPMATSVELMHTATLVHDDAVDKSAVRRGQPTINKVWGADKAVLLGDYLFAKAGEFCANTGNLRVITLFSQTLATISSGELRQTFDAFNLGQTREQYLQRIASKTASLFSLATQSGATLSQAPERSVEVLRDYGHNLGVSFQIVDDLLDFIGTEEELGKPVGSDLAQGTLTLPAMLLLERYPEDNPIKRFFQNRDNPENDKKQAIELVRNSSVVQECYDVAAEYCTKACQNLNLLPDNVSHHALVELANYVIRRRK
jgi:octaprenyl-diphosphate synthase